MSFARRLHCRCSTRPAQLRLSGRIVHRRCTRCGDAFDTVGADIEFELGGNDVPAAVLHQPLRRRGLVAGDIFAVRTPDSRHYYQLG